MEPVGDPRRRAGQVLAASLHPHGVGADGLPILVRQATGARFTDTGGREFIDWHMGFGAVLLGHRHPAVDEAIRGQLDRGILCSVPQEIEVEVAERLVQSIPCAEQVGFGKNGSDACTAAIRIARAVTGREGVLCYGYHGFHDWCAVLRPGVRGLPAGLADLVYPLPFNDGDAVAAILREHGPRIAAVIVEPMRDEVPTPEFLDRLQHAVRDAGALLVFDEMVTGLRRGLGGMQAELGITPDLACFGKALTNGMPLSAVVGPRRWMQVLPDVHFGMTGRGEALSLAAARAVLEVCGTEDVAGHAARIGAALREGFTAACARHGLAGEMKGHPAMQSLGLVGALREPFLQGCRARGVFTNGHFLPSLAHDEEVVGATLGVVDAVMAELA